MERRNVALMLVLIILCLSMSLNVLFYWWLQSLQYRVNALSTENLRLKETLEILQRNLEYHHPVNASPAGTWIYIVGVVKLENGSTYGEILKIYARFIEGSGNMFIATSPRIGIELQASAETALIVAQKISGVDASNLDCMLTVVADRQLDVIDGPSAGAAIAILLTLTLQGEGENIRRDVVITGTIESDGKIGKVGGILEKAVAAAKNGATKILVPKGQAITTAYREEVTRIGPLKIIQYVQEKVNIQEYLEEQGYNNVVVVEVSNILEAIQHFKA